MAAIDNLNALLQSLPNYSLLTDDMKQRALNTSMIPDGAGIWPGQPGYQDTYDVYWAATGLIGFLMAQPVVRQHSSEGTSIAVDAPNWTALLAYYKSQSVIAGATKGGPVLVPLEIPGFNHVKRVNMNDGGDLSVNVDTDAR